MFALRYPYHPSTVVHLRPEAVVARLTAAQRKNLSTSSFAVKSKAKTAKGKAKSGSYPIPDAAHARDALARSAGKPVAAQVRRAVAKKFPGIKQSKGK